MNLDARNRLLDEAEEALESASGGRYQAEVSFIQRLLCGLGADVSLIGLSPGELLSAIRRNGPLARHARDVLEILALPSQRPTDSPRAGDWMLRGMPGTGDVGHVSVVASEDLLTHSMLASEAIAAESGRPGYYALVIEAGAFPHSRVRPFARRVLDSRGHVPPDTVFLRPAVFAPDAAIGDAPAEGEIDEPPQAIDPSSPDLRIDPADPRIDVLAKFALRRMIKRPDMAVDAARLIRGINGGTLAGIFGENLRAAAKLAEKLGTVRWKLVPNGEDAALILDAEAPTVAPPTIIFRVKEEKPPGTRVWPLPSERMDPALQKASRTFDLFERGELGPCASSPSAIPVPNVVPAAFCHLPGSDLLVIVTEQGIEPSASGPAVSGALVRVEGEVEAPSPSSMLNTKLTDETGQASFPNLAPGTYRVTASKEGFKDASLQARLPDGDEKIVEFADEGSPATPPVRRKTVSLRLPRIVTQVILIEHPDQNLPNAPQLADEARWGVQRKGGIPGGATTPLPTIPAWEDAAIRIVRPQGPLLFPVAPDGGGNPRNGEATIHSAAGNDVSVFSNGVHKAPIVWHVTSDQPIGTIDGLQEARLTGRVRFSLWADPSLITENNMSKELDKADDIVDDLSLLITVQNDTQAKIQPDWDVGLRPSAKFTERQVIEFYRKIIDRCHAHKVQVLAGFGLVDRGVQRIVHFDRWLDGLTDPEKHADGGKAEAKRFANALVDFIDTRLPGFDGISFDIESCGLFGGSPLVPVNKFPGAHKSKIDKLRRALRFFYHAVADRLVVENRVCAITVGGMMSDDAAVLPLPSVPNVNPNAQLAARLHTYDLPIGKPNIVIRPMGYDNAGGTGKNAKIPQFNSDPAQFEWHKAIVEFALKTKRVNPQQFQLGIKNFNPPGNTGQGGTVPEPSRILRRCTEILRPNRTGLIFFAMSSPPRLPKGPKDKGSLGENWHNNAKYNRALNADPSGSVIPRPRLGQPLQIPLNTKGLASMTKILGSHALSEETNTYVEAESGAPSPADLDFRSNAVIDARIDVCAQFALLRMRRADASARADAAGMLAAVKSGQLAGILNHTTFAAVQLARRHGATRFDLVPRGEDAALVLDPDAPIIGTPSIVFRGVETKAGEKTPCPPRERLDPALRKAWATFLQLKSGQLTELTRCELSQPSTSSALSAASEATVVGCLPLPNIFPPILGEIPPAPKPTPTPPKGLVLLSHPHVRRVCSDGKTFSSDASASPMSPASMNPGFITAGDGIQFDSALDAKLLALIVDKPKYAALLSAASKKTRTAHKEDKLRVALVDLTGDKICKPGFAGWGSTTPISGGSTAKIGVLYAVHQLLFDLNEMARTGGLAKTDDVRTAASTAWAGLTCKPDLNWLVDFDDSTAPVKATASARLEKHLKEMVDRAFSGVSTSRASELIMRLGFEYIASVMFQSGLRHPTRQGLWFGNLFKDVSITAKSKPACHSGTNPIVWAKNPLGATGITLTAFSAATFFTLLAQGRLVDTSTSSAMEARLKDGCRFLSIAGVAIRATKCGQTSSLLHDAALLENSDRRYVLVCLTTDPKWPARDDFMADLDRLIKENNP